MFNLTFFFKYIGNFVLFLQYSGDKYVFKQMLKLNNFIIYFNLINFTDLDKTAISNYLYFFRYFFGILPFFTNYKHNFHLNVHYFSFFLQFFFKKNNCYNYIFIFLNDIYYPINKIYIEFKKENEFFEFKINDMNFFIEKKNTLGFFSLIDTVFFKFFLKKNIIINDTNLLYLFKFKI